MPARTYRLKIVQEGREFEAEGDKKWVSEMLKSYGPQASVPAAVIGLCAPRARSGRMP